MQPGADCLVPFPRPMPKQAFPMHDFLVSAVHRQPSKYSFGKVLHDGYGFVQMTGRKASETPLKHTKELVVTNKLGIHARPAALFVRTANRFHCEIFVVKDDERVNGKSIMGLMMLAAGPGSKLQITAEGEDAARALLELEALLHRKFDED